MEPIDDDRYSLKKTSLSVEVSIIATFTALVAVATIVFSVNVPSTKGYFNLGEVMVFTSAILFGARVGGIAGGLGSMIADLLLGYPLYAPATLVIKGLEGTIVGILSSRVIAMPARKYPRSLSIFTGAIFASLLGLLGVIYYGGFLNISLSFLHLDLVGGNFYVSPISWILISCGWLILILFFSLRLDYKIALLILSVMLGGLVMVMGYFIYEWFLFGSAAIVEVPINIGQMIIGGAISIPLTGAILRRRLIKKV